MTHMSPEFMPLSLNLADWTFRALAGPDGRVPPVPDALDATVPGTVHLDLLRHGRIPDPFVGLNELEVQWVGETAWLYRSEFVVPPGMLAAGHLDLCLDGLDTLCTVSLNGQEILRSENMFVPHRLDVRGLVVAGANVLTLRFDPVMPHGRALEAERGQRAVWNGDASRVYVRKAQYHYGWDWGPTLLTAGPWKAVFLHAYAARLDEVRCPLTVADDLLSARVDVRVTVAGTLREGGTVLRGDTVPVEDAVPVEDTAHVEDTVHLELRAPGGEVVAQATRPAGAVHATLEVAQPALWWPNGHGAQPLYTLSVTLRRGDVVLDQLQRRVGARHLRLAQDGVAGERGCSFTFVVNHVPLFAGGANWIPEDLLLSRVTPAQYRERLTQAADAHMVMIRVWGGGVFEPDVFYDLCDELGLLVWQDFLFACGMYPAFPDFLDSVRAEAVAAVSRLRHHACLALWCGNNEDYQIAESLGASGPGGDPSRFDALVIYERLLPEIVQALNPEVPYWPGSPFGGASSPDQTVGDRHTWEVWHGPMAPHRDYGLYEGRFVSEFGLQSPASLRTIERFAGPADRQPHSRVFEHHNKAADPQRRADGPRRLAVYHSDTFQPARSFADYVYQTRLVQAEAMVSAYRAFRGRWGQDGARAVSGALVWQLNDTWPATSWAIIDAGGLPKPAYYSIRRELAPLAVQARRDGQHLSAWLVSALREAREVEICVDVYALAGELLSSGAWTLHAAANAVTPLDLGVPQLPLHLPTDAVVFLRLLEAGQELSRAALWPEPLKHFEVPDPALSARLEGRQLHLAATRPARGVWIDAGQQPLSDNHLDLRPGEQVSLTLGADVNPTEICVQVVGGEALRPGSGAP